MDPSISTFLEAGFDPETTSAMAGALELACKTVTADKVPAPFRQFIAREIIKAAETGERDPRQLCSDALKAMGYEG